MSCNKILLQRYFFGGSFTNYFISLSNNGPFIIISPTFEVVRLNLIGQSYYYNSRPVAPVTQVTHVRMCQAACSSHTHTARANAYIHRKHTHTYRTPHTHAHVHEHTRKRTHTHTNTRAYKRKHPESRQRQRHIHGSAHTHARAHTAHQGKGSDTVAEVRY